MINLLPPDYKSNMRYARRNTYLRKWTSLMLIALLVTALIIGAGWFILDRSIKKQTREVETATAHLKEQKIDETKARLDEISSNMKLILQVLSKEVLFSSLIRQLGATLPAGTTLQDIQIDKVEGAITLKAKATNIDAATQLQVNLSDPNNKLFEKADIDSISCAPKNTSTSTPGAQTNTTTGVDQKYPCTVNIRALFTKNNPYVYISRNAQ